MSFFGKIFSGKKETTMTSGEAIKKLRETEKMLSKKQEFLEKKIDQEIETAKKNGSKNKRGTVLYKNHSPCNFDHVALCNCGNTFIRCQLDDSSVTV